MPELGLVPGIYHGVIERARYDNGVMWARVWIPAWSNENLKYITNWARVSVPWGTYNFGTWGSIHAGEHVWVAFEQADPERPVVIGFIPMPQVVNEEGKNAIEMPPELVNDCPYDKAPHTDKRDDPPSEGTQPINSAWIVKTPLEQQFFLLHDKMKKVVLRVSDSSGPSALGPVPKIENMDSAGDVAQEAIRTMGIEEGLKFLGDVLARVAENPEFIAKEAEKLVNLAIDKGCEILKNITGVDVRDVVDSLEDLIEQAQRLLGGGGE